MSFPLPLPLPEGEGAKQAYLTGVLRRFPDRLLQLCKRHYASVQG